MLHPQNCNGVWPMNPDASGISFRADWDRVSVQFQTFLNAARSNHLHNIGGLTKYFSDPECVGHSSFMSVEFPG